MKFSFDINLDCPNDLRDFLNFNGMRTGRELAGKLGFEGEGSVRAANALIDYAWNKSTAKNFRKLGYIESSLCYEEICDSIYDNEISGKIECW